MITGRRVSVAVARKTPLMFRETARYLSTTPGYQTNRSLGEKGPFRLDRSRTANKRKKKEKKKEERKTGGKRVSMISEEYRSGGTNLLAVRIRKYLFRASNQRVGGEIGNERSTCAQHR